MAVTVNTTKYEWSHGRTPRQARHEGSGAWAFQIDENETPIFIYATYRDAVKQAKQQAQHTVTVLP